MPGDERFANLELLRDSEMERARQEFNRDGKYSLASAIVYGLDGHRALARLDLHDEEQRIVIRRMCIEHNAWFVQHVMEVWVAEARLDDPAELAAQRAAKKARTVDRWPGRKERLIYADESVSRPVRMWAADISRDPAGQPTLCEFREVDLKLPYPGWKRYLPQHLSAAVAHRGGGSHAG